jgi:hypothetical protein
MPDPNSLESLLDVPSGGLEDPTPPEPAEPAAGAGDPKPTGEPDKKTLSDLVEQNKNLQEQVRQINETNKTLSEWRDKILGATPDDKKKAEVQEQLKQFDENPVGFIQSQIEQGISKGLNQVESKVDLNNQTNLVHRVMQDIDKTHIVDWDRDYEKINKQLVNFNQEALDKDPEGCIIAACKLAGAIKKREGPAPPYVEPKGGGGAPRRPAGETEEDAVNKRLDKISKNKSGNVFRI